MNKYYPSLMNPLKYPYLSFLSYLPFKSLFVDLIWQSILFPKLWERDFILESEFHVDVILLKKSTLFFIAPQRLSLNLLSYILKFCVRVVLL